MPHPIQYSVYPGEYILLPEVEARINELKLSQQPPVGQPPLNLEEFDDCFRIEMPVPGVNREQIYIYTQGNALAIAVMHKNTQSANSKVHVHEFETAPVERAIALPANADTGFISATCNHGLLVVYIPKTTSTSVPNVRHIAVY